MMAPPTQLLVAMLAQAKDQLIYYFCLNVHPDDVCYIVYRKAATVLQQKGAPNHYRPSVALSENMPNGTFKFQKALNRIVVDEISMFLPWEFYHGIYIIADPGIQ